MFIADIPICVMAASLYEGHRNRGKANLQHGGFLLVRPGALSAV